MKGIFLIFGLGWCVLSMYSCKTYTGKSGHDGLSVSDCIPDRKNQEKLANQQGSIIKVSGEYIILSQDGNSRFMPCNLPESYKRKGEKVIFTLIVKEVFPNERLIATPAFLTEIKPRT